MTSTSSPRPRFGARARLLSMVAVVPLALAACGTATEAGSPDSADNDASQSPTEAATTEVGARSPRLVLTHDGGVQVLDAGTLEVVGSIDLDGFVRVNAAGDGRHVLVSTPAGFEVLDAGTWAEPHGDHSHYYTTEPTLTGVIHDATTPGHVVVHGGRTALFDDGTGEIVVLDSESVALGADGARTLTTPQPHHGVAVELGDGTIVVTDGSESERSGVRVLDADGHEVAATDDCPGVHGEASASDETVVLGCEDGVVIASGGDLTKVDSPDAYGRIGNLAGSEFSPYVLGDYKTDPDDRPDQVAVIDTRSGTLDLVELPGSYTFRSMARTEDGSALVLGTDGSLHVIDPERGEVVDSVPLLPAWTEPEDWQAPRPTITALDGSVYVTDPANDRVLAVDVPSGEVWAETTLDVTPNELTGVTGDVSPVTGAAHDEHEGGEHEHDHEGGEHDHDHEGGEHEHDHEGGEHDHDHEGDEHDHDHDDDHEGGDR